MKKNRRLFLIVLSLILTMILIPSFVFADDGEEDGGWADLEFIGDGQEVLYSDGEINYRIVPRDGAETPESAEDTVQRQTVLNSRITEVNTMSMMSSLMRQTSHTSKNSSATRKAMIIGGISGSKEILLWRCRIR